MKVKFFAVLAVLGALLFASCANASSSTEVFSGPCSKEDLGNCVWISSSSDCVQFDNSVIGSIEMDGVNFQLVVDDSVFYKGYFTSATSIVLTVKSGESVDNISYVKGNIVG